jgi:hypothetical protein
MKRRLLQRWAIWLLPLLLARAFVPAGFMLSAQAGELSLIFCSGIASTAAPQVSKHAAHQHHAGHATEDGSASGTEAGSDGFSSCPFAVAGAAPTLDLPHVVGHLAAIEHEESFAPLLFSSAGPARADRIRGPPTLI